MLALAKLRPTVTVAVPLAGGFGVGNRFGGFWTGTTGYQVLKPPGVQPQPYPGTKAQLPYRYGIQPHGYDETHM